MAKVRASTGRCLRASGVLFAAILTACGGGGGGGGVASGGGGGGGGGVVNAFDTAEFRRSYGLGNINVLSSYNAGYTGAGQTVAIIDTGIDLNHNDLNANISANSIDIVVNSYVTVDDFAGHGTMVAGVVAAEKNGFGMHGVAYNAKILAIRADALGNCFPDKTCGFIDPDLADALDYAVAQGAGVINMSLGGPGASDAVFTTALLNAVNAGAIITISAGNAGGANPHYPALYAQDPTYKGQIIAVGATDSSNQITSFSNLAGTAQANFLVAPGKSIYTTSNDGGYTNASGTSFSAPHVAGAAALLKERFPLLTSAQIVALMYATAIDLGTAGTDSVFGRGLLNIDAALAPLGWITIPLPDGTNPGLIDSRYALGPAFGDALTADTALAGVLGLDSWNRAFPLDLRGGVVTAKSAGSERISGFVQGDRTETVDTAAGATSLSLRLSEPAAQARAVTINPTDDSDRFQSLTLSSRLGQAGVGLYFAAQPGPGAEAAATLPTGSSRLGVPQLSLLGPGDGVSAATNLAGALDVFAGVHRATPRTGGVGGTLAQAWISSPGPGGVGRLAMGLGAVNEDSSLFRTTASGAFGNIRRSQSQFLTVSAARPLTGNIDVFGVYTQASAKPDVGGGIISDWGTIRASSFAVGVKGQDVWTAGDRLTLSAGQPLRVDRAHAALTMPVARNGADGFHVETRTVNAVPSGRELDLEISYGRAFSSGGKLTTMLGVAVNPGHQANARPSAIGGIRFSAGF